VAILDHAETLNPHAANAFLKVLEEPPRWAVAVLVAPGPDALLPTVASRCVHLRLGAVDTSAFADLAPHPALRLGQPGPLLRARADPESFASAADATRALLDALDRDLGSALTAAEEFARQGSQATEGTPLALLREPLRGWAPARYAAAIDALERCEAALASYANPTLALAVLALELRALR
jgi:hypothetical protein